LIFGYKRVQPNYITPGYAYMPPFSPSFLVDLSGPWFREISRLERLAHGRVGYDSPADYARTAPPVPANQMPLDPLRIHVTSGAGLGPPIVFSIPVAKLQDARAPPFFIFDPRNLPSTASLWWTRGVSQPGIGSAVEKIFTYLTRG